jgi:hypothetical protein
MKLKIREAGITISGTQEICELYEGNVVYIIVSGETEST